MVATLLPQPLLLMACRLTALSCFVYKPFGLFKYIMRAIRATYYCGRE